MKVNYINLTPHTINLNDGRSFAPSGEVARVSQDWTYWGGDFYTAEPGFIWDLPRSAPNTFFIVSAMVLDANKNASNPRTDLCAPATGHPQVVRNEAGQIVSVPGFVR